MTVKQSQVHLRCTPEEKELLVKAADKMGVNITQFVLSSAQRHVDGEIESDTSDEMKTLLENAKLIRQSTRLLCMIAETDMKNKGQKDEFDKLMARAKNI